MQDSKRTQIGFWLLIGLLALFAGGKAILFDTLDPDCFWHLRVAAQLHRDGIGPIVDDLSFASSKQPWTPYSWLAELGMKSVWDFGGYRTAVAITAISQALIVILLAACCLEIQRHRSTNVGWATPTGGQSPPYMRLADTAVIKGSDPFMTAREPRYLSAVIATAIGTFLILPYLSFRPVTFAFVLLFAIAWLILRDQRIFDIPGRKARDRSAGGADSPIDPGPSHLGYYGYVWCIVPLTILLTNIHLFSFFVPAMVLAMAMGAMLENNAKSAMRYSLLAIATSLACLATPMLPGLLKTIFFYSAHDKMVTGPVIAEMQSFAHGPMGKIAAVGVTGMLICVAMRFRAIHLGQLICVAAATLLMFKLGRFAPLFALAACPAMAATMPALKDRLLMKKPVLVLLACVLLMGIGRVIASFPSTTVSLSAWVNRHGEGTPGYPCAAADYLDHSVAQSTGHLINEFSWGGYLAWRLDGKFQVLMDGRTQVYPQLLWQSTYLGSDIDRQKFLAGIQADAALVPVGNSKFRDSLIHLGWAPAYKDDRAEVLLPPGAVARIE